MVKSFWSLRRTMATDFEPISAEVLDTVTGGVGYGMREPTWAEPYRKTTYPRQLVPLSSVKLPEWSSTMQSALPH
jgi:hypothetical protein